MSTGIGYDCHRLAEGRPLVIGGVTIEHELGLDGHSDADVLTHAIIDAMLGACALGDIGQHFPDTDPATAGADSIELLRATVALLAERGFVTEHVDATVVIERPKLAPAPRGDARAPGGGARPRDRARQRQGDPWRGDGLRRARRGRGRAGDRDGRASGRLSHGAREPGIGIPADAERCCTLGGRPRARAGLGSASGGRRARLRARLATHPGGRAWEKWIRNEPRSPTLDWGARLSEYVYA